MIAAFASRSRKFFIAAFAVSTAAVSSATFATSLCAADGAPKWSGLPVIAAAQLAPLSRVRRDLAFLAEGSGQESAAAVQTLLDEFSAAVDVSRPAGMAVTADGSFVSMIFVPILEEERLFALLHSRFGWEFNRGEDGLYRGLNVRAVARAAGKWLFFTSPDHRDRLTQLPADPSELFADADPGVLAQITVFADRIPDELRGTLADIFSGTTGASEEDRGAASGVFGHALQHVVAESKTWQMELQCFRPLEQFHLATRVTPVAGSELEEWISSAAKRPALMEHLATTDSTAAAVASAGLAGGAPEQIMQAWRALEATARAKLPSARSNDAVERSAAQLGATALDAVSDALAKGEIDAGFVVRRPSAETVFLAGSTLAKAREVGEAAAELLELLNRVPDFQALQWAAEADGDVTIHQFQLPADDKTRAWVGDTVHLAAGFGADRVYAAAGGAATSETLSQAIERSREDAPSRGGVMRVALRMAPLLALIDEAPGASRTADADLHRYAELMAQYRRNDVLEFNLTAAEGALEGRLRIDRGVVRMLASAVPKTSARPTPESSPPVSTPPAGVPSLALRSTPGARFQIRFDTDSDVTTTIDDAKRVDRGRYSTIYDFRVLEARRDGAIRLEAALTRATIGKSGPDGDTNFDTAAKNQPEKMTPETVLYAAMVDEPFQLTVTPDGRLDEFGGLAEAVDRIVDNKLQPPANERNQAKAFVEQSFNVGALRDVLGRAFEFYPGKPVVAGDRWARTVENVSGIHFLLDNKYQMKTLAADEAVVSVRGQIRETEADAAAPVRWEVLGTQTGTIRIDPRSGRLLTAEYVLTCDAEATLETGGKTVVRPVASSIKMTIGPPAAFAEK